MVQEEAAGAPRAGHWAAGAARAPAATRAAARGPALSLAGAPAFEVEFSGETCNARLILADTLVQNEETPQIRNPDRAISRTSSGLKPVNYMFRPYVHVSVTKQPSGPKR